VGLGRSGGEVAVGAGAFPHPDRSEKRDFLRKSNFHFDRSRDSRHDITSFVVDV
jgi:hypothetical protein